MISGGSLLANRIHAIEFKQGTSGISFAFKKDHSEDKFREFEH